MTVGGKWLVAVLAGLLLAGAASAHYPFLHYTSRTAPFTPVPEKFDLDSLPNGVLQYFISEKGPATLAPGDSFASVISQIRLAARVWSEVGTSRLRLGFGGLSAPDTPQSTPRIDVLFDELPPGLVAMGGPTARSRMVTNGNGAFVPIQRSVLVLQKDLSQRPSSSDAFFLTAVHELGHALGLQHSMSSSVMSTQVTRATTRSQPLAADDVAGISALYPAPALKEKTASLTGRVTLDGQGVHLASVVAIDPGGPVVTALTDPDGRYRIEGLPAGQYFLYAHPLPPAVQAELGPADIVLPADPDGNRFPAGPLFQTEFYPGTKDVRQAKVISVKTGEVYEGFDFSVKRRGPLEVYGITTYSFPGNYAVKPAFVNMNGPRNFLVASGAGLITRNAPTPGLQASVMGGSASVMDEGVKAYAPAPSFLQLDLQFNLFSGDGRRHLLFALNNDLHVLPAGVTLVRGRPPSISSVTPFLDENGRTLAAVAGKELFDTTRILFDGLPAEVVSVDENRQSMVVAPPPGASGHRAAVTALNLDGQTSLFLDALAVPFYVYDPAPPPFVTTVTPAALPAGSEAMIEINGVETHFSEGHTLVGFGTSDISVRRVWVLSPTRLLANVHIAPSAPLIAANLTVVTGFEVVTQPFALQIQAGNQAAMVVNPQLINPATNLPSIYAGGHAKVFISNLPEQPNGISLTLDDKPAEVLYTGDGWIVFVVPGQLSVGPAVLTMRAGAEALARVAVQIDPPPPVVIKVLAAPETAADTSRPAVRGQLLTVIVSGLAVANPAGAIERLRVTVGGVDHVPAKLYSFDSDPNVHAIDFHLSSNVPAGTSVPLTVLIDDRLSQPYFIPVVDEE